MINHNYYKNTDVVQFTTVFKVVKFIPFCILEIGPDDG